VSQSKKWLKLSRMMLHQVFKKFCSNYTKENEVTINWNSSVKKAILKRLYPEEDFTSTAKTILSKMADRLDNPTNLNKLLNGDTEGLEVLLASRHLDFLKEECL
jgi:hypothetical protein